YGKPFIRIFEEADYDFYKIDPKLFAPSTVIVNNLKSGRVFAAGSVNKKILRESFGLK
ncbi:MAG: methenyltetrahydromethanopterin cyclohydrolase, partial [Candidatus Bathyarchaeia archaeon]